MFCTRPSRIIPGSGISGTSVSRSLRRPPRAPERERSSERLRLLKLSELAWNNNIRVEYLRRLSRSRRRSLSRERLLLLSRRLLSRSRLLLRLNIVLGKCDVNEKENHKPSITSITRSGSFSSIPTSRSLPAFAWDFFCLLDAAGGFLLLKWTREVRFNYPKPKVQLS